MKNYLSSRTCNKVTPGHRGLSADDGVPDGRLADGGGEALLSSRGRQKPEAGKLLHQRHPNEAKQGWDVFRVRNYRRKKKNTLGDGGFQTHLYLLCIMA